MDNHQFYTFEHNFWDITSTSYDRGFGHVTSQSIRYLLEEIEPKTGDKILDIACGPGYVTKACADLNIKVIGIDFSHAMIELAQKNNPQSEFKVANAEEIPFENQSFDGISCNFGILHFPNPEKVMTEAYRLCKKGSKFAYAVWDKLDASPAMSSIMHAIEKCATNVVDLPEGPPFFYYADQDNSIATLKKIGFNSINFKKVTAVWNISSAKDFVEYFRDGGARIGAILRAQSPEVLENIISAVEEDIEQYRSHQACAVPVSMIIVSGQR